MGPWEAYREVGIGRRTARSRRIAEENRPIEVLLASSTGHREGDLIVGGANRSAIEALVERIRCCSVFPTRSGSPSGRARRRRARAAPQLRGCSRSWPLCRWLCSRSVSMAAMGRARAENVAEQRPVSGCGDTTACGSAQWHHGREPAAMASASRGLSLIELASPSSGPVHYDRGPPHRGGDVDNGLTNS